MRIRFCEIMQVCVTLTRESACSECYRGNSRNRRLSPLQDYSFESCAFRQLSWRRIGLMHFIAYQYDGSWLEQSTVTNSNALVLAMTDDRRVKIKLNDNKRCRALLLLKSPFCCTDYSTENTHVTTSAAGTIVEQVRCGLHKSTPR